MSNSNQPSRSNPLGQFFPEPLRQRMSEDLHLTGKARRTHDGYIRSVRQLSDFARCSPDKITETQVRQFFLYLKNDRQFAYGSLRVALSGVKFFFTHTCKRDCEVFRMLKLRNINTLRSPAKPIPTPLVRCRSSLRSRWLRSRTLYGSSYHPRPTPKIATQPKSPRTKPIEENQPDRLGLLEQRT